MSFIHWSYVTFFDINLFAFFSPTPLVRKRKQNQPISCVGQKIGAANQLAEWAGHPFILRDEMLQNNWIF